MTFKPRLRASRARAAGWRCRRRGWCAGAGRPSTSPAPQPVAALASILRHNQWLILHGHLSFRARAICSVCIAGVGRRLKPRLSAFGGKGRLRGLAEAQPASEPAKAGFAAARSDALSRAFTRQATTLAVYYVSHHEKSYAVVLSMRIVPDGTRLSAAAQALQQSSVRYEPAGPCRTS